MLTIRDEQMTALEKAMLDRFVEQQKKIVEQRWPQACTAMGEDRIESLLRGALDQCSANGIEDQTHVIAYIDLLFSVQPDPHEFSKKPTIGDILTDRKFDPDEKINRLEEILFIAQGLKMINEIWPSEIEQRGEDALRGFLRAERRRLIAAQIDIRKHGVEYIKIRISLGIDNTLEATFLEVQRILDNNGFSSAEKLRQIQEVEVRRLALADEHGERIPQAAPGGET